MAGSIPRVARFGVLLMALGIAFVVGGLVARSHAHAYRDAKVCTTGQNLANCRTVASATLTDASSHEYTHGQKKATDYFVTVNGAGVPDGSVALPTHSGLFDRAKAATTGYPVTVTVWRGHVVQISDGVDTVDTAEVPTGKLGNGIPLFSAFIVIGLVIVAFWRLVAKRKR